MNIPAAENLHLHEENAEVCIPFEYNLNDKGCLFAGSIYAGAIVAAYRAAECGFSEGGLSGHLVAKTASISYLKSIVSEGRATAVACGAPLLKSNGNHTLTVKAAVSNAAGVPCAEVTAEFVLLAKRGV